MGIKEWVDYGFHHFQKSTKISRASMPTITLPREFEEENHRETIVKAASSGDFTIAQKVTSPFRMSSFSKKVTRVDDKTYGLVSSFLLKGIFRTCKLTHNERKKMTVTMGTKKSKLRRSSSSDSISPARDSSPTEKATLLNSNNFESDLFITSNKNFKTKKPNFSENRWKRITSYDQPPLSNPNQPQPSSSYKLPPPPTDPPPKPPKSITTSPLIGRAGKIPGNRSFGVAL